jgi:acetyl esterase/lipase
MLGLGILMFGLTGLTASVASSAGAVSVERDVAYGALPRQNLDIYLPAEVADGAPILVFFHGGLWMIGQKEELHDAAEALAASGLIVVVPNYRLFPDVVFPDFVKDGAAAVAFAYARFSGGAARPRPLFIMGHSAGAEIAALIAFEPGYLADAASSSEIVSGFIGIAGVYNLTNVVGKVRAIFPAASAGAAEPRRLIDRNNPPSLLVVGERDQIVGTADTTDLLCAIRKAGGSAEFVLYKGLDHFEPITALTDPGSRIRADIAAFVAATVAR